MIESGGNGGGGGWGEKRERWSGRRLWVKERGEGQTWVKERGEKI